MAPPARKRKRPSSTPPRLRTISKPSTSSTSKITKSTKSKPKPSARLPSHDTSPSLSPSLSQSSSQSPPPSSPNLILAEIIHPSPNPHTPSSNSTPAIPLALLHRILHHHFTHSPSGFGQTAMNRGAVPKEKETRLTSAARQVLGKYVEIFAREAVVRSGLECQGEGDGEAGGGGGENGDGWLEVEHLEKMAPQLVLDF